MRFIFYFGWCLVGAAFSEVLFDAEESRIETPPGSEKEASGEAGHRCVCVRDSKANGLETEKA